jgi:hypothetical protein
MNEPTPTDQEVQATVALALGELAGPELDRAEAMVRGSAQLSRLCAKVRAFAAAAHTDGAVLPPPALLARVKAALAAELATPRGVAAKLAGWLSGLARLPARVAFDSGATVGLAGFRSGVGDGSRHLTLVSEAVEVDLALPAPPQHPVVKPPEGDADAGLRLVRGQVSPLDGVGAGHTPRFSDARVEVIGLDGAGVEREAAADEKGRFTLAVSAGKLRVFVRTAGGVVELPEVEVE